MDDDVADGTPTAETALMLVLARPDGVFAIALTLLVLSSWCAPTSCSWSSTSVNLG